MQAKAGEKASEKTGFNHVEKAVCAVRQRDAK
jgi:hypothetical protein